MTGRRLLGLCLGLCLSLGLFGGLLSCYSSQEIWYHTLPKRNLRYYAMHVRFSDELLRYFAERDCKLNSAESWTLYFSRDPDSYTPYGKAYIPNYWDMRRNSDIKLLLPTGTMVGSDALKVEQKTGFFSAYPVITAIPKRSYSLKNKDALSIKRLQGEMKQKFSGTPRPEIPSEEIPPKVVDKKGLVQPSGKKRKLSEDLANYQVEPDSRWPPSVIEKKNTLLQRAKDGVHFLNYMLMIGVNQDDQYVRIELWDLPIVFSDTGEQFQYLGELEIGKYWDTSSKEAEQWDLRYDYWGRANLSFRINDRFYYWQAYLNQQLGGAQRDRFHSLRIDLEQRGPKFIANLPQNIAEQNPWRRFPYLRMDSAGSKNCRF